jgi:hypothetical protein
MVKKRLTLCNCLDHDVHAAAARESRLVTGRYIPGALAAPGLRQQVRCLEGSF